MQEAPMNKMQGKDTTKKVEAPIEQPFFFPEQGVTIIATSLSEAQAKLAELINKK